MVFNTNEKVDTNHLFVGVEHFLDLGGQTLKTPNTTK